MSVIERQMQYLDLCPIGQSVRVQDFSTERDEAAPIGIRMFPERDKRHRVV